LFDYASVNSKIVYNIHCVYFVTEYIVGSNVGASDQKPDCEFNVWTKPDCAGTSYENRNRCVTVHE